MPEPTLHVSLTELGEGYVEMRFWRDNPNQFQSRRLTLADIGGMVRSVEPGGSGAPGSAGGTAGKTLICPPSGGQAVPVDRLAEADLAPLGRQLYRWLDGPARLLARELPRGATAIALAIDCAGQLAALPWEVLHDGTGFLVEGTNPGVLPVRWRRQGPAAAAPANRAFAGLFMATSPEDVRPVLDYEAEEREILQATKRFPMALAVEETGDLDELEVQVRAFGAGALDVVHLSGHAEHTMEGPRFLTESATGARRDASAREIAGALPHRPRLVFLSGCRTGQAADAGSVQSLAEELLTLGFPAVLGWGRPVYDTEATKAAGALYGRLSSGEALVPALLGTFRELRKTQAKHWHLLRLFVAGELPGALVTPPRTAGRKPAPVRSTAERFLDAGGQVKVASREAFRGRRRPLQRVLRELRANDHPAGVVMTGPAGAGKSSLACRVCDRLGGTDFEVVVHAGVLDEPGLLASLAPHVRDAGQRAALQGNQEELRFRLQRLLEQRRDAGERPLLVVLDAFNETVSAREVLEAMVFAINQVPGTRCLVTSREKPATGQLFYQEELGHG